MVCEVCGKHFEHAHYSGEFKNICGSHDCFEKKFWQITLDEAAVVIDGKCYHIGEEKEHPGCFRGFGGAKFVILFKDGRKVTTTNLWSNGKIPEEFHREDNAEFVRA